MADMSDVNHPITQPSAPSGAQSTTPPTALVPRVPGQARDKGRTLPVRPVRPLVAVATALGLFAAARISGGIVLAVVAAAVGKHPFPLLGRSWDSQWYVRIAEHGYGRTVHQPSGLVFNDLAFFPVYPLLVRAVRTVTGLTGGGAGLLISWTAAAVAACGIYLIGARLHGRAAGTVLVLVWGLLPHSIVLSLAYTEPLLTAFAAWSLYAVLSGHWAWAGTLAALAGLSRPNGLAVAVAVLVAAAHELWRRRLRGIPPGLWAGAVLAPLGWGGYVLWVGVRTGDPFGGYFGVQHGWGSAFDLGRGSLHTLRVMVTHSSPLVYPMTIVIVAAYVLLFALLLVERVPLPLVVYSGVLLVVALGGSGYFCSKPRFLLPAFPLLLPVACALARTARARPWHATLVVAALAGLSFSYGAHLVVLSRTAL